MNVEEEILGEKEFGLDSLYGSIGNFGNTCNSYSPTMNGPMSDILSDKVLIEDLSYSDRLLDRGLGYSFDTVEE